MRTRRRVWPKVLLGFLVLLTGAAVGGYWYERPLLLTGTGYAAHNACALHTIAGRDRPETDLPTNPLVPYLSTEPSDGGRAFTSTIKGILAGQKAWVVPGHGCTVGPTPPKLGEPTDVDAAKNPLSGQPTPTMSAALAKAMSAAYGEELPADGKATLGTRGIVVVKNGRILAEQYAPGFTKDTRQLGWSMSKSVTNLLVGRLVKTGKITLAKDHLVPSWTDDRGKITVEQLLRMTSGLTWDETYDLGTPITRMLYAEPDMAAYVASQPLAHAPGTFMQYSSGSTTLLCSVLRSTIGEAEDLPGKELFAPLGLGSAVWERDGAGTPVCSSYLWATPRDWAAIGQFALQGGGWGGERLLPDDWMARSTTLVPVPGEEKGYAAGWRVNTQSDGTLAEPDLPPDAYWANGHDGQRLYIVPSASLVVARLGFSPDVESKDLRVTRLVRDVIDLTS